MNLREAAEYIEAETGRGVLPSTLRQQVYLGKLRAKKKGRDYFVTPGEVRRYIRDSAGRRQPPMKPKVRDGQSTPCVLSDAGGTLDGYGRHADGTLAHRRAWEEAHGPIPDGLCVLHRCDNPPCVNVEHLFLGTRDDNNKDRADKGRSRPRHGDLHGRTVVPDSEVPSIMRRREAGETLRSIADDYGVSTSTIGRIASGSRQTA